MYKEVYLNFKKLNALPLKIQFMKLLIKFIRFSMYPLGF